MKYRKIKHILTKEYLIDKVLNLDLSDSAISSLTNIDRHIIKKYKEKYNIVRNKKEKVDQEFLLTTTRKRGRDRNRTWSDIFYRSFTIKENGCWEWNRIIRGVSGYGIFVINQKTYYAHRISYLLHFGEILENMDICHKCDNKKCVNPNHLFIGTRKDNMIDCVKKGRNFICSGEKSGCSKLKNNDVEFIRNNCKILKTKELARKYNVSTKTIRDVILMKTWKHI